MGVAQTTTAACGVAAGSGRTLRLTIRWSYDRLTPAQQLLFQVPRPEIEFYDTERDPFEVDNLAGLPEYRDAIAEHYSLLADWRSATGDFPAHRRRRDGYVDRVTGVLYSLDVPPMYGE